jgi:drug/metabolite transporter (DMT)-like permease
MQTWVLLSLLSAFSLATSDALTKKVIRADNEYVIGWYRLVYALPVLFTAMLAEPVPPVDRTFFLAFCAALPLEIAAILLYYRALRVSPLSLSLPFLSFTPLFLLLFSRIVLHERVSPAGTAGIALIVLGGYALNLSSLRTGVLEPFRAIVRERGSRYMVIIALIYSATSALGKLAIAHSSAAFFGATYYCALAFCLLPVIILRQGWPSFRTALRNSARAAVLPGVFDALAAVSHFYAMSMANVAFMVAVKRSSLLIGSLYGFLFFGERNIRERAAGAVLMFSGFLLVVLSA